MAGGSQDRQLPLDRPGVAIVLGDHRSDPVTTYPFKVIRQISSTFLWQVADAVALSDHASRGGVVVGDDVWLGANGTALSGVTIGSRAVIGAGAVVCRDVPAYAVLSGSLAGILHYRFGTATIARLLRVDWWSWPDERITRDLRHILKSDTEIFLEEAKAEEPSAASA